MQVYLLTLSIDKTSDAPAISNFAVSMTTSKQFLKIIDMLKILKKKDEKSEKMEETNEIPPLNAERLIDESDTVVPDEENEPENDAVEENAAVEIKEEKGERGETAKEEIQEGMTPEFRLIAESFAKGKGLPAERLEQGMEMLEKFGKAWRNGNMTVELLEVALRGLDYERAVAQAYSEGELKGRNTQIEEKYMRPEDSDGLPHPSGHGNSGRSARRVSSIFDLARDAG